LLTIQGPVTTLSFLTIYPALAADPPLRLGNDLQLFVDGYLIESVRGADLKLHEPRPAGRAITFDRPWEGNVSAYVTIFRDSSKVRMYYRGASDPAYVNQSALRPGETPVPKSAK
jgi:hypothetical protein